MCVALPYVAVATKSRLKTKQNKTYMYLTYLPIAYRKKKTSPLQQAEMTGVHSRISNTRFSEWHETLRVIFSYKKHVSSLLTCNLYTHELKQKVILHNEEPMVTIHRRSRSSLKCIL